MHFWFLRLRYGIKYFGLKCIKRSQKSCSISSAKMHMLNFWTKNRALAQCATAIRRNLFRSIASQIYVL